MNYGAKIMFKAALIMFIGTIIVAFGDGFLSKGLREIAKIELTGTFFSNCLEYIGFAIKNPIILLGVLCHATFFFLLLISFSLGDLSYVLPINALTYIFAAIIAKVYLHEDVNLLRWIGTIIIVIGVFVVLLGQGKDEDREKKSKLESGESLKTIVNSKN